MKKVIIAVLLIFAPIIGLCQSGRNRVVSVEIGMGGLYSFDRLFFDKVSPGLSPYGEIRYNFKNIPLSLGVGASAQIFTRSFESSEYCDFTSTNLMIVSDYAFYRHLQFKSYFGLNLGVGIYELSGSVKHEGVGFYSCSGENSPLCVVPHVGVEVWNHLRLSMGYMFEDKANRNLYLRIGYAF